MERKKVLITGADGFIGSHLTELLISKGYNVRALSQYNSFNHWGWIEEIRQSPNLEIVTGDIRDPHYCKRIVEGTDIIFHLAALIAIPYSYVAPDSYVDTNIKGTLNICQASKEFGGIRIIHTSTSEVYGTAKYIPIDENHPKQPQSPYSASKIGADMMALSFYNSFSVPVTIARPFNTYGPRQSARAIIPTIIIQIAQMARELKLGDLKPTRDFNFVTDTCEGFLAIAECDETIGKEINISSNSEVSVEQILEIIQDMLHTDIPVSSDKQRCRPENSEVFRLYGDNTLIKKLTNWNPKVTLREGLEKTIEWIIKPENLKKYKSDIYNL